MKRMVLRTAAVGLAMLGVALGGPQSLPSNEAVRTFGADPIVETCNGNGKSSANCPSGQGCILETYEVIDDLLPGTEPKARYNNAKMKCTTDGASKKCKFYDLTDVQQCAKPPIDPD